LALAWLWLTSTLARIADHKITPVSTICSPGVTLQHQRNRQTLRLGQSAFVGRSPRIDSGVVWNYDRRIDTGIAEAIIVAIQSRNTSCETNPFQLPEPPRPTGSTERHRGIRTPRSAPNRLSDGPDEFSGRTTNQRILFSLTKIELLMVRAVKPFSIGRLSSMKSNFFTSTLSLSSSPITGMDLMIFSMILIVMR
jgi:hypothetical protein